MISIRRCYENIVEQHVIPLINNFIITDFFFILLIYFSLETDGSFTNMKSFGLCSEGIISLGYKVSIRSD